MNVTAHHNLHYGCRELGACQEGSSEYNRKKRELVEALGVQVTLCMLKYCPGGHVLGSQLMSLRIYSS